MIIPCFRCGKQIDTPDSFNADYVIASDIVVIEPREVLIALKHNQATLEKVAKMKELNLDGSLKYPNLSIPDNEYDEVEIPSFQASKAIGEDLVKVIVEIRDKDIQKTGVICPDCYKPTDTVIWGIHKK